MTTPLRCGFAQRKSTTGARFHLLRRRHPAKVPEVVASVQ